MTETLFNQDQGVRTGRCNEALQQYIEALLARQRALDLLESVHPQIKQAWTAMRQLLEGLGFPQKAKRAVCRARATQACVAREAYRALEKRREECLAALHDAERRAHAAWQMMLLSRSNISTVKSPRLSVSTRVRRGTRPAWQSNRRQRSLVKVSSTLQLA